VRKNPPQPPEVSVIGDVVISIETAARQAGESGQSIERRLRALLVHGVLHLLGYDHERSAAGAKLMFGRQAELEAMLAGATSEARRVGNGKGR
jgi:rRNA maturation RNase YbeY